MGPSEELTPQNKKESLKLIILKNKPWNIYTYIDEKMDMNLFYVNLKIVSSLLLLFRCIIHSSH